MFQHADLLCKPLQASICVSRNAQHAAWMVLLLPKFQKASDFVMRTLLHMQQGCAISVRNHGNWHL